MWLFLVWELPGFFNRVCFISKAVSARFKIDPGRFVQFFRTCLRRTLAQMICDVRRIRRRNADQVAGGRTGNASGQNVDIDNAGNSTASPVLSGSQAASNDDRLGFTPQVFPENIQFFFGLLLMFFYLYSFFWLQMFLFSLRDSYTVWCIIIRPLVLTLSLVK